MDTQATDYGESLWRAGRRWNLSIYGAVSSIEANTVKSLTLIMVDCFLGDDHSIIMRPTLRILTSQRLSVVERMISRTTISGHEGRWLAMNVNISPHLCRIGDATFRPGLGKVSRIKLATIPPPDSRHSEASHGTTAGHTLH